MKPLDEVWKVLSAGGIGVLVLLLRRVVMTGTGVGTKRTVTILLADVGRLGEGAAVMCMGEVTVAAVWAGLRVNVPGLGLMVTVCVSALMVDLMAVVWAGLEASVLGVNLMVTVCVVALVTEAVVVLGTVNVNVVGHQLGGREEWECFCGVRTCRRVCQC